MKISTAILLAATTATVARAQYDSFFFSTNATDWDCPGLPFRCQYPYACSHDSTVDKYYCCIPGSTSDVCWTGSPECSGDNGGAGPSQLDCGGYCCLENREICTESRGQINICWATAANPLADATDARMNQTYSSLASASPAATELSFQLAQVISSTSSSSAAVPVTITITTTATSTTTPPGPESSTPSKSGLTGGAIAGIVVGAVVAALIVVGAAGFFWRRGGRKSEGARPSHEPHRQPVSHEFYGDGVKQERQQSHQAQPVPQEMADGVQNRTELDSNRQDGRLSVHELPSGRGL